MSEELANRLLFSLANEPQDRAIVSSPGLALGSVRGPVRKENQDRPCVALLSFARSHQVLIGLVCDGMGGLSDGGQAAAMAASHFIASLAHSTTPLKAQDVERAVGQANEAVYKRFRRNGGTTLTAAVMQSGGLPSWIAHVGDSRAYVANPIRTTSRITSDDTLSEIVHGRNIDISAPKDDRLIQFVGIGEDIRPHITELEILFGEWVFITSDGAHSIGSAVFDSVVRHASDVSDFVRRVTFVNDMIGCSDNASVVALNPHKIEPSPRFHSGMTVHLWTGTGRSELWLSEIPAPQKPAAAKRIRKKASAQSAKKDAGNSPQEEKANQIRITFGDDNE